MALKATRNSLALLAILLVWVGLAQAQVAPNPNPSAAAYSNSKGKSEEPKAQKNAPAAEAQMAEQAESGDVYRIGVEDELLISVWREPELSGQVAVRPDGLVTLPLLNEVKVVGLTTRELQDMLTEKLKGFLAEPQVTVVVRQIRSRKVYLVGQVPKPGMYPLNGRKTVLQLLAEAGGIGQFAKGKSIYIVREVNGKQARLPFNYKKALEAKEEGVDFQLQSGDMIVVP